MRIRLSRRSFHWVQCKYIMDILIFLSFLLFSSVLLYHGYTNKIVIPSVVFSVSIYWIY